MAKRRKGVEVTVKISLDELRYIEWSGNLTMIGLTPSEVAQLLWTMESRFNSTQRGDQGFAIPNPERMHVSME